MLENLKVDVIYYRIPKDFEMEFNLCGCCRMRLLNSVADDIKSLINSLKLAVARSKIILLCGEINGEKNLFDIISKAICRETEEVDNSIYGISSPGTTRLMKNSIPLITKDGNLCGCVVEEGPQSIIILSENKEERKEIMNSLVHQYISELSAIQIVDTTEDDIDETKDDVETPQFTEENSEQPEEFEESPSQPEIQNVECATQSKEPSSDFADIESESENDINSDILLAVDEDEPQDSTDYDVEAFPLIHTCDGTVPHKKPRSHSKHSKPSASSPLLAILICLLLCLIGILAYFLILKPLQSGISISDNFFRLIPFLSRRFL